MNPNTLDWMRSAAKEIIEDNLTHGSPLSRHEVNALAEIIAKHVPHCPNAAGDAREVTFNHIEHFITWWSKMDLGHVGSAVEAFTQYKKAMQQERAKASQTP